MSKIDTKSLTFYDNYGEIASLTLKSNTEKDKIIQIDELTASDNGEASIQLQEWSNYEFELNIINTNLKINQLSAGSKSITINHLSMGESSTKKIGLIGTKNQIGTLRLFVADKDGNVIGKNINMEVKSTKIKYREEYRDMLKDISKFMIGLIYTIPSSVYQNVKVDPMKFDSNMTQQFYYLKEILTSDPFTSAIQRIIHYPFYIWKEKIITKKSSTKYKIGKQIIRQIASGNPRMPLPTTHYLHRNLRINSYPNSIRTTSNIETVDNPENQFVKHTLSTYLAFFEKFKGILPKKTNGIFINEINSLMDKIENILNYEIFHEISDLNKMPGRSQVLQRKPGYRYILKTWLEFHLSSMLSWDGNEDIYQIGKKDIATLYEYWVFIKLYDILSELFEWENHKGKHHLVELNKSGLSFKLKAGREMYLEGRSNNYQSKVKLRFYYNRVFSAQTFNNNDPDYNQSWSVQMRPDYSLIMWTSDKQYEEVMTSVNENVKIIHFDAKYKIHKITEFHEDGMEINRSTEKREDLLRMHAYHDAIRRSYGSYVIFPGDFISKNENNKRKLPLRVYTNILPSIGAFPLKPKNIDMITNIKNFINDLLSFLVIDEQRMVKWR